jgi:micrococcal nuclease
MFFLQQSITVMKLKRFLFLQTFIRFALWALLLVASLPLQAQKLDQSDTCECIVSRVVDGDTFFCANDGDTVKVRILGIDTFEYRTGDKLYKQAIAAGITPDRALALGNLARDYAKQLLTGKVVTLYRGGSRTPNHDNYTRLLRYVIVDDEQLHVIMRSKGFAAFRR